MKEYPIYELATYLDAQKNWRKLKPHFESETFRRMWRDQVPNYFFSIDSDAVEAGRIPGPVVDRPVPEHWTVPQDVRNGYWYERHTPGRLPAYWPYMWLGGCHWLVDAYAYVARQAFPQHAWIIAKSKKHACVWSGDCGRPLVFDPLYQAHGCTASEALENSWENGATFRRFTHYYEWLPGAGKRKRKTK